MSCCVHWELASRLRRAPTLTLPRKREREPLIRVAIWLGFVPQSGSCLSGSLSHLRGGLGWGPSEARRRQLAGHTTASPIRLRLCFKQLCVKPALLKQFFMRSARDQNAFV